MIGYLNKKRGQSTLEYAVLVVVVVAALISIQVYVKRSYQGRMKSSADDIGDQFSPGNTNAIIAQKTSSHESQQFGVGGQGLQRTTLLNDEITNTVSQQVILHNTREYWGNGD